MVKLVIGRRQQLVEVDLDLCALAKPKCNDLSLKLKYEVIKTVEKEPKIDIHKLAGLFSSGKTQISTIPNNKQKIV